MASSTVSSFTQTTQIQTTKTVDAHQTKTITNELLDQFLDSQSEITMDLMEELRIFEEFLNSENDFLDHHYSCGEVILNKYGILIYKCNLCKSTGQEFINISNYEEHLRIYHPTSQKCINLPQQQAESTNDIYPFGGFSKNDLWIEELFKIEKSNDDSYSMEFLEHSDKSPAMDELVADNGHHRKSILQNKPGHAINIDAPPNKNVNNKNNEYMSNVTSRSSSSPEQYEQTKTRKKRTPGYCEICQRRFNDLYNLRVHMMIHTGEKPYQCEDCGKKFRQYNKLKIHRVTHTNKRPFMCDICGKGFRFRNYLSVHKRLHSGEKPYKCKFCDEYFHSLHTRRLHMKILHAATEIFTCSVCGKILTSQCYLTAHMKRHTNQRDYECDVCAKRFFSLSQLKDHQMSHTNIKPFQCHICEAKFQRKSNFNQHLKIHSNVKSYICNICHKAFAQNAGLYGHMKSHAKS